MNSMSGDSAASTPSSAMSVQSYRSQFIKEGLKIKVCQKLGHSPASDVPPDFLPGLDKAKSSGGSRAGTSDDSAVMNIKKEELTEEDELRRLRRRERNKIAATKCRNKKKLRTQMLIKVSASSKIPFARNTLSFFVPQESETLETQNHTLKAEINKLEGEKKRLMEILALHEPSCARKDIFSSHKQGGHDDGEAVFRMPPQPRPTASSSVPSTSVNPTTTTASLSKSTFFDANLVSARPAPKLQLNDCPIFIDGDGKEDLRPVVASGPAGIIPQASDDANFLAKRSLRYTYLDLDSRCIAL